MIRCQLLLSMNILYRTLMRKKMFDSDHARIGFTSPEGETGLGQHQEGNPSPGATQTQHFQEPLAGYPSRISPVGMNRWINQGK
jgi:hypothetical protein